MFRVGSWLRKLAKAGINYINENSPKGLQDDAQNFNAGESALNRDFQERMNNANNEFNARQSELARQFQEDFYNKYQSPKALMAQYQDAGINPMLAVGSSASSPPSVSSASAGGSPSGSAGSSGIAGAQPFGFLQAIAQMMKIKAEYKEIQSRENLNNSQAGLFKAQTDKTNIDVEFSPQIYRMNLETGKVNIQNMLAGIRQVDNNIELSKQQLDLAVKEFNQSKKESNSRISVNEAERILKCTQNVLVELEQDNKKSQTKLNYSTIGLQTANSSYITEQELYQRVKREHYKVYGSDIPVGRVDYGEITLKVLGGKSRDRHEKIYNLAAGITE